MTTHAIDADVYTRVHAELATNFRRTGASKHDPAKRLLEDRESIDGWLVKLDKRHKNLRTGGLRGIIFDQEACKRILRDTGVTDMGTLRDRIADAIVRHRGHALGVVESTTVAADPSSSEDGSASSGNTKSVAEDNGAMRRGRWLDRDRSRSRSRSRSIAGRSENGAEVVTPAQAHAQRGQKSTQDVTNAAMEVLYPRPSRRVIYDAAIAVMSTGVDNMDAAEKRGKWAALMAPSGPIKPSPAMRKLILAASGVIMGTPWNPEDVIELDTNLLTARVAHKLAEHTDMGRVSLALRIIRRVAHMPGADLPTILECGVDDVRAKMRDAHNTMFSWEMQWGPDNVRRVPEPWIADVCKTALRLLDDLL